MRKHVPPDLLWKAMLESRFEQAILFFRPSLHQKIDWSVPPEFLDKELNRIFPDGKRKGRRADILVKIRLFTGDDCWILIHIEVQGYVDIHFEERMYVSNVRITERFGHRVFSLALLTDDNPNWHPKEFHRSFEGTEMRFGFNTWKALEHPPESLAGSENPIAVAMETAFYFAKTRRKKDEVKLAAGLDLARRLMKLGWSSGQAAEYLRFIRMMFRFQNPETQTIFDTEIESLIQTEPSMTINEIFQQVTREEGREEGREVGRKEGREEGREVGREEGIDKAIRNMLLSGMASYMVSNVMNVPEERVQKIEAELRHSGELTD